MLKSLTLNLEEKHVARCRTVEKMK